LKGDPDGEIYEPKFTFFPVHYVQVEGCPGDMTVDNLDGQVIHTAIDMSGQFCCSSPLLSRIHQIVTWTMRNSLKGFPLDCLHREPLAYNEPASVSSMLFTRKHMPRFWIKWLVDIQGTQRDDGSISDWAPEFPEVIREHDAAQAGNYPPLVWYLYQYYDDERILSDHYTTIKAWVDFLSSIAEDSLITTGWLGDHMLPGKSPGREVYTSDETPPPLIWTGYYYRGALVTAHAAAILGKAVDAKRYATLAEKIKDALNKEFFDEETDNYASGSQTSNAFPLVLGVVPDGRHEGILQNIYHEIMQIHDGHIHTGHVGTTSMIEALTKYGDGEAMYAFATAETYPGWGYMVNQGSTTVWESWGRDWAPEMPPKAHRADSMMMWGCIDKFFYHFLAGIHEPDFHGPDFMAPGFRDITIKPHVLGDLTFAAATVKTVRGLISSGWKRSEDLLTLEVQIPVNSRAKVHIPKMGIKDVSISECGRTIFQDGGFIGNCSVAGIFSGIENSHFVELEIGSGAYSFILSGAKE
jgi:alpha-L-rhamnosidase